MRFFDINRRIARLIGVLADEVYCHRSGFRKFLGIYKGYAFYNFNVVQKYCMVLKLTERERRELRQLHRQESCRRFADRIKTVLLLDSGWSYAQIAEALLLDD